MQNTELIKEIVDSEGKIKVPRYQLKDIKRDWKCRLCDSKQDIRQVYLPYVMRYLAAELASVNISLRLDIKSALQLKA